MTWELGQKITTAEYEANKDAIGDAVAVADAKFIREELKMLRWKPHHRDALGMIAEARPTKELWDLWHFDRIQIDKRSLEITKLAGKWIVRCYNPKTAKLLVRK